MLVAPFTLSTPPAVTRSPFRAPTRRLPHAMTRGNSRAAWAPVILGIWLIIGVCGLIVVPATRGSATLGATLPFWLVIAPLLDLAWLKRADIATVLRRQSQFAQGRMAGARACRPRWHWQG